MDAKPIQIAQLAEQAVFTYSARTNPQVSCSARPSFAHAVPAADVAGRASCRLA